MAGTLTAAERTTLARLESDVEAGVQAAITMLEAGKALAAIRDRQLFRDQAPTWESYVEARFKISRRRADQMISFAAVRDALDESGTVVPQLTERAARPLVGMDADTIQEVVDEAAADPDGITPATIAKAAAKRKPKALKVPKPVRLKVPGATVEVAFNAKAKAAGFDVEAALVAALDAFRRQAKAA